MISILPPPFRAAPSGGVSVLITRIIRISRAKVNGGAPIRARRQTGQAPGKIRLNAKNGRTGGRHYRTGQAKRRAAGGPRGGRAARQGAVNCRMK